MGYATSEDGGRGKRHRKETLCGEVTGRNFITGLRMLNTYKKLENATYNELQTTPRRLIITLQRAKDRRRKWFSVQIGYSLR